MEKDGADLSISCRSLIFHERCHGSLGFGRKCFADPRRRHRRLDVHHRDLSDQSLPLQRSLRSPAEACHPVVCELRHIHGRFVSLHVSRPKHGARLDHRPANQQLRGICPRSGTPDGKADRKSDISQSSRSVSCRGGNLPDFSRERPIEQLAWFDAQRWVSAQRREENAYFASRLTSALRAEQSRWAFFSRLVRKWNLVELADRGNTRRTRARHRQIPEAMERCEGVLLPAYRRVTIRQNRKKYRRRWRSHARPAVFSELETRPRWVGRYYS